MERVNHRADVLVEKHRHGATNQASSSSSTTASRASRIWQTSGRKGYLGGTCYQAFTHPSSGSWRCVRINLWVIQFQRRASDGAARRGRGELSHLPAPLRARRRIRRGQSRTLMAWVRPKSRARFWRAVATRSSSPRLEEGIALRPIAPQCPHLRARRRRCAKRFPR